ncbi:hypothetical protein ABIE45_006249 [Methylobacterium sp. OAE515]
MVGLTHSAVQILPLAGRSRIEASNPQKRFNRDCIRV